MPGTVLCVDNDRSLVQILAKALGGEGYRVNAAYDGDRALEAIAEEPPDLVLLDLILPRRDGFQVLEGIRELSGPAAHTPVVLLTACSPGADYRRRADALGAAALLTKPQPLDRLLEVVAQNIGESKSPPGGEPVPTPNPGEAGELSGSLLELPFAALLHHLHGMRATGVLHLSHQRRRKWIELREGYPVSVRSNLVNECLGNHLVKTGRISHSTMAESRRRMGEGRLQGEILVAMDVVAEDEIPALLREQAEEKLGEIFSWRSGEYRFERGARLQRGNELALDRSPANLILQGARERMPMARIEAFLRANAGAHPVRGESDFYRFQDIDLDPEHQELIRSLDGRRTLAEVLDGSEELQRILYALISTGMLELRGGVSRGARPLVEEATAPRGDGRPDDEALRGELAAFADRLRGQNHFEALGVAVTASDAEIRQAYERLAARVHPDRTAACGEAVRHMAAEVQTRLREAYETLADRRRRTEYQLLQRRVERDAAERAEGRQALDAEMQFQQGEAALRARDYETALSRFGKALELYPDEGEYHAHYGWALHLANPENEAMRQEAIEHVRRGLKLASRSEKPYLFMGRLCKVTGREAAAEKMFARAVQIQPNCAEALSELRLIRMRREKKKGFVRRLLRR